jgi:hypothetical protein
LVKVFVDFLILLCYNKIVKEGKKMKYLLVFDKIKQIEVDIKKLEELYAYAYNYKKVEIDFETSTIYISQKK